MAALQEKQIWKYYQYKVRLRRRLTQTLTSAKFSFKCKP